MVPTAESPRLPLLSEFESTFHQLSVGDISVEILSAHDAAQIEVATLDHNWNNEPFDGLLLGQGSGPLERNFLQSPMGVDWSASLRLEA